MFTLRVYVLVCVLYVCVYNAQYVCVCRASVQYKFACVPCISTLCVCVLCMCIVYIMCVCTV